LTRKNGVSAFPYKGLNLALHSKDLKENIQKNFQIVKEAFNLKEIYTLHQVHADECLLIDDNPDYHQLGFDAMITQKKEKALFVTHADCQPAIFFDPTKRAIATVHSGWRGSVKNIYEKTLIAFEKHFLSKREDIFVAIGPCLGPLHAEFVHFENELPESFWPFKDKSNRFNFWDISLMQLKKAGIKASHIDIAKICTYSDEEEFFSFRRQKNKSELLGANATFSYLK
jgi:YfiH family protein